MYWNGIWKHWAKIIQRKLVEAVCNRNVVEKINNFFYAIRDNFPVNGEAHVDFQTHFLESSKQTSNNITVVFVVKYVLKTDDRFSWNFLDDFIEKNLSKENSAYIKKNLELRSIRLDRFRKKSERVSTYIPVVIQNFIKDGFGKTI